MVRGTDVQELEPLHCILSRSLASFYSFPKIRNNSNSFLLLLVRHLLLLAWHLFLLAQESLEVHRSGSLCGGPWLAMHPQGIRCRCARKGGDQWTPTMLFVVSIGVLIASCYY